MSAFLDILDLLSSPPGALIYYVILLFSIWAIVGLALSRWSRGERGGLVARLLLAGTMMSFTRFLPIIVALLSRQGNFSLVRFAPPLERFVDALSVLFICWAFVFPQRYRIIGLLAIGISVLLTVVLYALSATSWTSILDRNPLATYNGSTLQRQLWELWQLVFLIPAFVYTLVNPARERDTLNIGLGVLIAGHVFQLVYPLADRIDHFGAWTRFANLMALPLFSAATYQLITQRFDAQTLDLQAVNQESLTQMAGLMSVLDTNLKISASLDLDAVLQDSVQAISQLLHSDLCALALVVPRTTSGSTADDLSPPDVSSSPTPTKEIELAVVYDATHLGSKSQRVSVDEYPAIQRAMAQSNPMILEADEQSSSDRVQVASDIDQVYRLLGYDQGGPLLIQPLEHASTVIGVVLVCRTENQVPFSPSEARKSETLAAYLSSAIENARRYQKVQARLQQLTVELNAAETQHTRLRADLENRLTRSEEQATIYMQRLYEAELGEQQAQEDARQARRKLAFLRQDSQTEITHARDELKRSIQQAAHLTQQIANLDAQCLELGTIVQTLEQEKGLLQLRLAVVATEQDDTGTDVQSPPAQEPLLVGPRDETASTRSSDGLLAALVHDLCVPMASVLEYTELFINSAADRLENRQSELLKRVQANTERMQGMLNNLISLNAMDKGTLVLQPARVDISKVIEIALARSRFRLEEKELKTRLEIGVLPSPRVDPGYMQQIVDNLVSHACRSSSKGNTIDIRAYATNGDSGTRQLHITISNTGPDLAAQESGQASRRSHRASSAQEADRGESRAELEIIETLVQAHQGQIQCDDEPGRGTTFYLTIPVEATQPPERGENGRG